MIIVLFISFGPNSIFNILNNVITKEKRCNCACTICPTPNADPLNNCRSNDIIYKALETGAVETLIVSADYHKNSQFKNIMKMLELAKNTSAKIEFAASAKIIQKLEINNSVLAILRYRIK